MKAIDSDSIFSEKAVVGAIFDATSIEQPLALYAPDQTPSYSFRKDPTSPPQPLHLRQARSSLREKSFCQATKDRYSFLAQGGCQRR
jgi:hypothetical protein